MSSRYFISSQVEAMAEAAEAEAAAAALMTRGAAPAVVPVWEVDLASAADRCGQA